MHKVHKVKEMLCEELEEFASKEKIDAQSLDAIDKLAHAIKNIDKILEYEETHSGGYSNNYPRGNYPYRYDEDMQYSRGMRRDGERYSNRYPNDEMYPRGGVRM